MQSTTKLLILILLTLLLSGCGGGGGKAASIPDSELRTKRAECRGFSNPSRIKVMACENYERECARRKDNGKRVCS